MAEYLINDTTLEDIADSIRAKLDEQGIILNDTVNGTTWDIKALY